MEITRFNNEDIRKEENAINSRTIFISKITIVIPVYQSDATIESLVESVIENLQLLFKNIDIVLVNDGSKDGSHKKAMNLVKKYPGILKYVRLSRNFGEHNAVMCGLRFASGDFVAIIDDDFQNPPEEIINLAAKIIEGYDVVYGYYATKKHNWFRNLGSAFNNWTASKLLNKPTDLYLSSFKLMNAYIVKKVTEYKGPYPYLDGLILQSTNAIASVRVKHSKRLQGRSNYTFRRLIQLWASMTTGFSVKPLRIASIFGFIMSAFGLLLAAYFIIAWKAGGIILSHPIPPGWASLIVTITVFSGLQLMILGIIGEYLGRLFMTAAGKPQFVVRDVFGFEDNGRSI